MQIALYLYSSVTRGVVPCNRGPWMVGEATRDGGVHREEHSGFLMLAGYFTTK